MNTFSRWQEEKDFEDFSDYVVAIKKNIPGVIGVNKRPFSITIVSNNCDVRLTITKSAISWKVTSMPMISELMPMIAESMTPLSLICENSNVSPAIARRKLRKANFTKPATGWEWVEGTDLTEIVRIITK